MVKAKKKEQKKKDKPAKLKQLDWNGAPAIGWWADATLVTFYYGIHKKDLDATVEDGIKVNDSSVFLFLEPNSGLGQAALHHSIVNEYNMQTTVPFPDRAVLVLQIPKRYFIDDVGVLPEKLTNKAMYDKWVFDHTNKKGVYSNAFDQQYYGLAAIEFTKKIPAKFIVGFTLKEYELTIPKNKWKRW